MEIKQEIKPILPNPANHKSAVWNHFGYHMDEDNDCLDKTHTVCRLCHSRIKYSGNTTNMTNHLRKRHFEVLAADGCLPSHSSSPPSQVPRSITTSDGVMIKVEDPESSPASLANPIDIVEECMNMMATSQVQIANEGPIEKNEAVAAFLIKDLMPISTISEPGFKQLIHTLDPRYCMPDEQYFAKYILSIKYTIFRERAMDLVSKANRVCVQPEIWTHADCSTYLTIWISFIDFKWTHHRFVAETENITAKSNDNSLHTVFKDLCEAWNIRDYVATSEVLDDQWADLFPLGSNSIVINCYGDMIQTAMKNCFQIAPISELIDKAWRMSHLINTNGLVTDVLLEYQWGNNCENEDVNCLPMAMSNNGQWQSTFELLKVIKSMQQSIAMTAQDPRLEEFSQKFFTTADFKEVEQLLRVMQPLKTAERVILEEEQPLATLILPLIARLKKEIGSLRCTSNHVKDFVKHLLQNINDTDYLDGSKASQSLLVATLLDPRFKTLTFLEQIHQELAFECTTQQAANYYNSVGQVESSDEPPAKRLCLYDSNESAINQFLGSSDEKPGNSEQEPHKMAAAELRRYLEEESLSLNSNPLKWWRRRSSLYPLLSSLARDTLCASTTCTSPNILFSTSGKQNENYKKSRLNPSVLHKMIFLNKNADTLKLSK